MLHSNKFRIHFYVYRSREKFEIDVVFKIFGKKTKTDSIFLRLALLLYAEYDLAWCSKLILLETSSMIYRFHLNILQSFSCEHGIGGRKLKRFCTLSILCVKITYLHITKAKST